MKRPRMLTSHVWRLDGGSDTHTIECHSTFLGHRILNVDGTAVAHDRPFVRSVPINFTLADRDARITFVSHYGVEEAVLAVNTPDVDCGTDGGTSASEWRSVVPVSNWFPAIWFNSLFMSAIGTLHLFSARVPTVLAVLELGYGVGLFVYGVFSYWWQRHPAHIMRSS